MPGWAMNREDFIGRLPTTRPGRSPGLVLPDLPGWDLVSLFTSRLQSVDGVVHGPLPTVAVSDLVAAIFGSAGATGYLAWDEVGVPGIHGFLAAAGIARQDAWVPEAETARQSHLEGYLGLRAGLTGADAGLAESGSIVLRSGPGRPRMAALAPFVHVAILPVSRMVRTLVHYTADHPAALEGVSNLAIVTGPSRTADIEQQLNLGVHGPKHVHVILLT